MAAGDFSASQIPDVLLMQDEIWADARINKDLQIPVNTAQAILENQKVNWSDVHTNGVCIGKKAVWIKGPPSNIRDNFDSEEKIESCDITGTQAESVNQTYNVNIDIYDTFQVLDNQCKDAIDAQRKISYLMLRKFAELENKLNIKFINFLIANRMANRFSGTFGTISSLVTNFPANKWNPDLIAEFDLTAQFNDIYDVLIINGTNLHNANFNAQYNVRNDDQRDQKAKFDHYGNLIFDPRNIDSTTGRKSTFLIDAGAIGFFSSHDKSNMKPQELSADVYTWIQPSKRLSYRDGQQFTPVMFEITMQRGCIIPDIQGRPVRRQGWSFEIHLSGGLHLAPYDTAAGTGILEMVQTPAEANPCCPDPSWLSGATAPSNGNGVNGDNYVNTVTGEIYHKAAGAWVKVYTPV